MSAHVQLLNGRQVGFAPVESRPTQAIRDIAGPARRAWVMVNSGAQSVGVAYWLAILVASIHLLVIMHCLAKLEPIRPARPLTMAVSMITEPAAKREPVVQAQPEKPRISPVTKKPRVKQAGKPPVKPTQPEPLPPSESLAAPPVEPPGEPVSAFETAPVAEKPMPPAITPPDYHANFASNPRPAYPAEARVHGWQGKVALRVHVTVEGLTDSVQVEQSSGYEVLDAAAIEAVKQWRFIPAKRGDIQVAGSVVVPLNFRLHAE